MLATFLLIATTPDPSILTDYANKRWQLPDDVPFPLPVHFPPFEVIEPTPEQISDLDIDLPETAISIKPNPDTGLEFEIKVSPKPRNIRRRREERKSNDKKMRHQLVYMAFLNLLNKTWGRVSEVADFWDILQGNLKFKHDEIISTQDNRTIKVLAGQALSDLPPEFKAIVITAMINGYDGMNVNFE